MRNELMNADAFRGYTAEKVSNSIHALAQLASFAELLPNERRSEYVGCIKYAIGQLLRVHYQTALTIPDLDEDTVSDLASGDHDRYETAAYLQGLIPVPEALRRAQDLNASLAAIERRLKGSRAENRTSIHDILAPLEDDARPVIGQLIDLTDEVSGGTLSWDEYQQRAAALITRIRQAYVTPVFEQFRTA